MKKCGFILFFLGAAFSLYATPDSDDGVWWQWNEPSSFGISSSLGKKIVAQFDDDELKLEGKWPEFQIFHLKSKKIVGHIRYQMPEGMVAISTIFPTNVPKERRMAVAEFFRLLMKLPEHQEQRGHYYVNPDSGECGFVRRFYSPRQLNIRGANNTGPLLLHEHWRQNDLYKLYPEMQNLIYLEVISKVFNSEGRKKEVEGLI